MKYIKKISLLIILTLFVRATFISCSVEEPTVVTPKTLDEYKLQFSEYVTSEKTKVYNCVVGYDKDNFMPLSTTSFASYKAAYLAALKVDSAVIAKPGVTIAELATANVALTVSGKAFLGKINISDRRALNDLIVLATTLNASAITGAQAGNVLLDAKTVFTTAITTAAATRDAFTTIDRQVLTAIDLLTVAKAVFTSAIIPVTIDAYVQNSKAYLAAQLPIVQNSTVGYNINQYNTTLQTNYLNALLAAQTTANLTGVTYAQLSASLDALTAPRKAFIANVSDRRALNDVIVVAETLNNATVVGASSGQVTQSAKTTFTTAITTAKTARETPTTADGTVKAAAYNLGLAKTTFTSAIIK